jgi:hypothetical protein
MLKYERQDSRRVLNCFGSLARAGDSNAHWHAEIPVFHEENGYCTGYSYGTNRTTDSSLLDLHARLCLKDNCSRLQLSRSLVFAIVNLEMEYSYNKYWFYWKSLPKQKIGLKGY